MSASSEPSAATAAPTRTTGTSPGTPAARTASASGAGAPPSPSAPSTERTADGDRRVHHQRDAQRERDRARDGARRIPYLLAQGGDPRVPGEREEQQTGRLQHPARAAGRARGQPPGVRRPGAQAHDHHGGEDRQHHRHDRPRQPGRLLHAAVVHRGQRHHGRDRHGVRLPRPDVRPHGERHRRAGGGLADDERPAGQVPPEGARAARARRRRCRPTPGTRAASRADDIALQYATTAATASPSSSRRPGRAPAGPSAAKIPAPTIDPSPTTTASDTPRVRFNSCSTGGG